NVAAPLLNNKARFEKVRFRIPKNAKFTSPYWLNEQGSLGMYQVEDPYLVGLPETPRELKTEFIIRINEVEIPFERELTYKFNDPVTGETYRPFEVVPQIS